MAKVLSSISGNLISAASAGFAPTNSGDVSAIASAYQVVSATAIQLYAGTAHVTSINGDPISASRAGNAANASMATSAYYDGTGRLISSLPDSAAVSAIASAYATAKVDKSSISAQSSQWNSVYNTVSNNSASWSGSTGGGGDVTSPSGTIFVKDGTAIEGTNSAVVVGQTSMGVTSVVQKNPQLNAIGPTGMTSLTYDNLSDSGMNLVFMLAEKYHGDDATVVISGRDPSWYVASASGLIVDGDTIANIPLGTIQSQLSASSDYWINLMYGQDLSGVKAPGYAVTGVRELAWQSAVDNVTNTVAVNSAHWGQGGVDSATVSAIASGYASGKADSSALSSYALSADVSSTIDTVSSNSATWGATPSAFPAVINTGSTTKAIVTTGFQDGTGSRPTLFISSNPDSIGYPRMLVSENHGATGKSSTYLGDAFEFYTGASANGVKVLRIDTGKISGTGFYLDSNIVQGDGWSYGAAKNDQLTSVYDTVSSNSATWGAGGIDSATCSAIASSYANDVSAAVSGTVDTVSTQSANWGGSALALSAGPGVTLTKSGNTLVAGLDETVLWSGETTSITGITLNESYAHFDRVRFYWNPWNDTMSWQVTDVPGIVSYFNLSCGWANNSQRAFFVYEYSSTDHLNFSQVNGAFTNITGTAWTTATACKVYKVVGINRTAGV